MSIFLLGEVNSPGTKEVEHGTRILQFLAETGGFTKFAATKRVQIRRHTRSGERVITLNYHALSRGARMQNDIVLHDGDVVLMPERRLFE